MRLTKAQSRIIAVGVILLVFIVGFLITRTKREIGTVPTISLSRGEDGSIDAKVIFGEFRKSEVKDGKKLWEVHALEGRYAPDKGEAQLQNVEVTVFREDDTITLTAEKAHLKMKGTSLSSVRAEGDVIINSATRNVRVRTEQAIYDEDKQTITSPGRVEVTAPQGVLVGEQLAGSVDVRSFTLAKNVSTVLHGREGKAQ